MKPITLKPCPFCGGEGTLCKNKKSDGYGTYEVAFIECEECGCSSGTYIIDGHFGSKTTVQDAVDAWNRRPNKNFLSFIFKRSKK